MTNWRIYVYLASVIATKSVPSQEACNALAQDIWYWHPNVTILCCEVGVDCPELDYQGKGE